MTNSHMTRTVGKRAIATILSATMVASGTVVANSVLAPSAFGAPACVSDRGEGAVTIEQTDAVAPGATLTVKGSDLKSEAVYTLKLDNGKINLSDNQTDGQLTYFDEGYVQVTSSAEGTFSVELVLPDDITNGKHIVRMLHQGTTPQETSSHAADFMVEGGQDPAPGETVNGPAVLTKGPSASYGNSYEELNNSLRFKGCHFAAGSEVKATINDEPVKISTSWHAPAGPSVTADENGDIKGSVVLPAKFAVAGEAHTIKFTDAEGNSTTLDYTMKDTPAFIHKPNKKLKNAAAGNTNEVLVSNLPVGSTITYVGTEGKNFLPEGTTFTATANNTAVATATIPTDADLVGQEVIVKVTVNGEERTVKTGTNVAVNDAIASEDMKIGNSAELPAGLYVPAFSKKHNAVFVTRSYMGTKPAAQILKVNAETLKLEKSVDVPAYDHGFPPAYAAFGIDVDEERDRVWVTNSLQGTVAVYDANTLALIKQFEVAPGEPLQNHAHQPVVDPATGNVYVSGFDERHAVLMINGETLEADTDGLDIPGLEKSVGMDLDTDTGDLYITSAAFREGSKPEVFKYNIKTKQTENVALEADDFRATNLSFDSKTGMVFVALQGKNEVVVVDFKQGKIVDRIATDAQPVYLQADADSRRLFVGNRTGETLSVFDLDTHKRTDTLPVGIHPNGITLDGEGGAYVVNMKNQVDNGETDQIFHVVPKEKSTGQGSSEDDSPLMTFAKVLGIIFGIGLLGAVLNGLFQFFHNMMMPPAPAPAPAPEAPAKDGHPVQNPVHR